MPALPVIADVFRVTFKWTDPNIGHAVNVTHISAPAQTAAGLSAIVAAHVTTAMWGPVTADAHIYELDVLPLDGTSATHTTTGLSGSPWVGGGSGAGIPAVAALIKLQTGLRGPANRGRIYLPFIAEGYTNEGTIDAGTVTSTTAAWDTFANDLVASSCALGVASYKHADWHQAIAIACEPFAGTQRRRQSRLRG
jgi:hypothetical protein